MDRDYGKSEPRTMGTNVHDPKRNGSDSSDTGGSRSPVFEALGTIRALLAAPEDPCGPSQSIGGKAFASRDAGFHTEEHGLVVRCRVLAWSTGNSPNGSFPAYYQLYLPSLLCFDTGVYPPSAPERSMSPAQSNQKRLSCQLRLGSFRLIPVQCIHPFGQYIGRSSRTAGPALGTSHNQSRK